MRRRKSADQRANKTRVATSRLMRLHEGSASDQEGVPAVRITKQLGSQTEG